MDEHDVYLHSSCNDYMKYTFAHTLEAGETACRGARGSGPTLVRERSKPVGSVRWLSARFPAGLVSRSRIRTIGSARNPTTESSQHTCVALPPVLIP